MGSKRAEGVVPTTSFGEGTLVRLCDFNAVQPVQRHVEKATSALPRGWQPLSLSLADSQSQTCLQRRGRRARADSNIQEVKAGGSSKLGSVAESQLQQTGRAIGASRGVDTDARRENMYLATRDTQLRAEQRSSKGH